MRSHAIRVVALCLCLPASSMAGTSGAGPEPVPLVLHMDGRITLAVRVNGAGPFRFRLDTGASRTVIGTRLVTDLGLPPAGESRTITQTGETRRGLVHLKELTVGEHLAVPDVTALVVDDRALDPTRQIDGLLGQDVLSRWPFTIDYEAKRLTVDGPLDAPPVRTVRLPLARVAGGLVALVPASRGHVPLRLVPDSGADRIVLFRSATDALPPVTLIEAVRVRSITGDSLARLVRLPDLDVGGIRLRDREGLLLDRQPADAAMGDGLLPLHLFALARFDVGAGYLELGEKREQVAERASNLK